MNEHKTADDVVRLASAHAKLVNDALNNMREERDEAKTSLLATQTDRDFVMEQLSTTRKMRDDSLATNNELRSKLSHQCDENETLCETLLAARDEKLDLETTVHALRKLNSSQTDTILKLQTQHENQRETILELQRAAGIRAKPSQREYLRHELMDRASTMSNIFEAMIMEHPARDLAEGCFSSADHHELNLKIETVDRALGTLYQFIGDKHL